MQRISPRLRGPLLAVLCLASAARAQSLDPDHSCTASAAFLWTLPEGPQAVNYNTPGYGFQFSGGVAFTPRPPIYSRQPQWFLTGSYTFARLTATDAAVSAAYGASNPPPPNTKAQGSFSAATLDLTPRFHLHHVEVYGLAGFGWLQRGVTFSTPATNTLTDPNSTTLRSGRSNSGAFDAAVGINFLSKRWRPFVEGRVIHGLAVNKSITLVTPSAGLRW